jgi:hypothetical protein
MKQLCSILLLAGSACAGDVHVYVGGEDAVPAAVLQSARAQATWMFAKVAVPVRWHNGEPPAGVPAIQIRFTTGVPDNVRPAALAYAHPFAKGVAGIVVLYDRVRLAAERRPGFEHRLLAHVLAHEIGHVLGGTNAHSESGVMKARWTLDDYEKMMKVPLSFTATDRELIVRRATAATPSGERP